MKTDKTQLNNVNETNNQLMNVDVKGTKLTNQKSSKESKK